MATRENIFQRYLDEYLKADKDRKGAILDHVEDVTRMHRKAVVRKFRVLQLRDPATEEKRGRRTYYTKDVDAALDGVWQTANQPCGELLHPMIGEYVTILRRDGMWTHGDVATGKLLDMGEHTVRRRVSGFVHTRRGRRGISGTKPSLLKQIIPIFKGPWGDKPPGYGQIDTVAHCGGSLSGSFVWTLNYTDVATYWIIPKAQWNKGQEATKQSLQEVKENLPVDIIGLHPDTGGEFINHNLLTWCTHEQIELTRSEPGKKNDNICVEERNGHVVRKYLGYTRFDCPDVVPVINELYTALSQYLNHFQAVRRTRSKERVGARYKRAYEKIPLTPHQRMLAHPDVTQEAKDRLREEHTLLNPLVLLKKIDMLTARVMKIQKQATVAHG